jgi:glycolate oxidase
VRAPERLEPYTVDESGLGRFPIDAVALCETREEVEIVLRLAREHRLAVTPRGAGTGMTGGALAARGGLVLSTERMTRIREIDEDDLVAIVEPGVVTGVLADACDARGLFYPPDPASLASSTIGGNVAENAGGPRAFRYGVTREYVLGLEVVLMGGEVLRVGRRTPKGVTGYDVTAALVGSEGTFAVTTEVVLRLLPKPPSAVAMLAVFADVLVAGRAVSAILRRGAPPRALELLDRATIEHLRGQTPARLPVGAGALLLVEIDGEPEGLEAQALRLADACVAEGALDVVVAQSERDRRDLWETRRRANPLLKQAHRHKIPEDVVVPRSKIPALLAAVDTIAVEERVAMATYGHAGDGNLHINLLVDEPLDENSELRARVEAAMARIMRTTIDLGGTLAGEHGVGLLKMKYLPWEQSPPLLRVQRELKRLFDPDDLLNPGKILPPP